MNPDGLPLQPIKEFYLNGAQMFAGRPLGEKFSEAVANLVESEQDSHGETESSHELDQSSDTVIRKKDDYGIIFNDDADYPTLNDSFDTIIKKKND